MENVNYMQRVGFTSCVRCDFTTEGITDFDQQDKVLTAHLNDKHPNWMTEGIPSPQKMWPPAPSPAAPGEAELPVDMHFDFYRDSEGDYIMELVGDPKRHIACHGETPNEVVTRMVGMLDLVSKQPVSRISECKDAPPQKLTPEQARSLGLTVPENVVEVHLYGGTVEFNSAPPAPEETLYNRVNWQTETWDATIDDRLAVDLLEVCVNCDKPIRWRKYPETWEHLNGLIFCSDSLDEVATPKQDDPYPKICPTCHREDHYAWAFTECPATPSQPAPVPETWGSRCVECGNVIPAGQMQKCEYDGGCNHHVPRALEAEIARLRSQLAQETRIVNHIWAMFGTPSYEELKGRTIYDLIQELKDGLVDARRNRELAEEELRQWFEHRKSMLARAERKGWNEAIEAAAKDCLGECGGYCSNWCQHEKTASAIHLLAKGE